MRSVNFNNCRTDLPRSRITSRGWRTTKTVHVAQQDGSSGAALATEEEFVLRCLGVAIIMQWNALPTTLRREIFDTGKLLETAALRGQIARFLHKHKDDAGRGKLPLIDDTPSDARFSGSVTVGQRGRRSPRRPTDVNKRR
jgi:hypothetical protein